jgi:SAM-dependent methyltransferase
MTAAIAATTADHQALVARTLQIAPEVWRATLEDYARAVPPHGPDETLDEEIERCVRALAAAYGRHVTRAAAPAAGPPRTCPICAATAVRALVVRPPRAPGEGRDLVIGRCTACGHGLLLEGGLTDEASVRARYAGPDYYRLRDAQGVGYDGYDRDAAYRERKGTELVARLRTLDASVPATLLEVGSGYGFSRVAAERAGIGTGGVDVNAHACAEALRRYGLTTFHGTLAEALDASRSGIERGAWDSVLYQFVLEHIPDPIAELAAARQALRPGGWLVLLLPGMDAAEIDGFGASYRSFRADHLHLFSRASTSALLTRAGFALARLETFCNIHLFAEVLSPRALARVYETGRGPDLFVLARSAA